MGATYFTLGPPDFGHGQVDRSTRTAAAAQGAVLLVSGAARVVPHPTWFTYAPELVTYNHLWVFKTSGIGDAELDKECKLYHDAFTRNPVEYLTMLTSLLETADGMVFLAVLSGDQVCMVNSIGRFTFGLGKHTPSHNNISGLMEEKS